MATATETIETQKLTPEKLLEILSTPEGQNLLASANRLQNKANQVNQKPHTDEEIKKFYKLAEKDEVAYIQIDPATQKQAKGEKDFIWKITYAYPWMVGAAKIKETGLPSGDIRVQFQLQKYWKNKFVRIAKDPMSDPALPLAEGDSKETHLAWSERDSEGGLSVCGDRHIDASDFEKEFQRVQE